MLSLKELKKLSLASHVVAVPSVGEIIIREISMAESSKIDTLLAKERVAELGERPCWEDYFSHLFSACLTDENGSCLSVTEAREMVMMMSQQRLAAIAKAINDVRSGNLGNDQSEASSGDSSTASPLPSGEASAN